MSDPLNEAPAPEGKRRPADTDLPALIDLVSEGASLRAACRQLGLHTPSTHTWLDGDDSRREQYARAREQRADLIAEQVMTVAQGTLAGRIESDRARVAIDAFKWTAGKMAPKRYGDKITQEHTGAGGGAITILTGVPRADS